MEQCEIHREILNLPPYVFPAVMAVFGYPTEQQKARKKPERFKLEDIVCENTYQRKDPDSLREIFGEHCGAEGIQNFCARKYNSEFSREMTRSVDEYLKQYK